MNTADAKRILETALICSQQPLPVRELRVLFNDELGADTIKSLLQDLQNDWTQRGVELVSVATGWRFQSRPELRDYLDRLHPEKPPRYSRATLETLAIIAYRQPVTRGDMEDIRGVTINSLILKQLEDRGWVEVIGHRETVGRPALFATTRQFLDDLGIESLDQLPVSDDTLAQTGMLDALNTLDPASQPALPMASPTADAAPVPGETGDDTTTSALAPSPADLDDSDHATVLNGTSNMNDQHASELDSLPDENEAQKVVPGHTDTSLNATEVVADDSWADDLDEDADESEDGEAAHRHRPAPSAPPIPIRFSDVVSGQFDADEESADLASPKRVLAPQAESPKLHKVLAQSGMGSRLEMEQLIVQGRISVNNEPAHIGQRIQFGDQVKVNGKPIRFRVDPPPPRVLAYHKPVGEVVTHDDPQNRPTVFRRLPKLAQGKWQSVGRLDLNTEGLLLFTSSGELANNLMHPRFGLEREYAVRVLGALSNDEKQHLLEGVKLDDGVAQFGAIEDGGGEGSNCWYRVTISEGRNREVRRMLEAVGHAVSRLIRIRYGAMVLPRGLKRGAWLELDEHDIQALLRVSGSGRGRGGAPAQGREGAGRKGGRNRRRGGRSVAPRGPGEAQPDAAPGGVPGNHQGQGGRGQGQRRKERGERDERQGASAQPDPMKTAFGYIGADSFTRQRQGQGQGPGRGQRRSGGGSGGGANGGGGPRRGGGGRGR